MLVLLSRYSYYGALYRSFCKRFYLSAAVLMCLLSVCMLQAFIVFGSIFLSVHLCVCLRKNSKTTDQKLMNLVGIWTMVNTRSGWKLVTFDLDLESYSPTYPSYNFWMAWPSNFVFGVEIRLENVCAPVQFQGHKVKVTAAKNSHVQVWFPIGHSLILLIVCIFISFSHCVLYNAECRRTRQIRSSLKHLIKTFWLWLWICWVV